MSDLLNKASLVVIPSGYKEDTVYSVVPSDGSGDLSFTRASNGTRINSAGLVEVTPWNLVRQSNTFSSSPWGNSGATLTSGQTDPNGGANAWKVELAAGSSYLYQPSILVTGVVTMSAYLRADSTTTIGFNDGSAYPNSVTIGTTWQRYEFSFNVTGSNTAIQFDNYFGVSPATLAKTFYIYGAQLNIGSTAKPYFPTTDRLNVPRLTYQNGGGGCPSLLLEKQSTNLITYSENFDQAYWPHYTTGSGTVTKILNNAISPDGTQNADEIRLTRSTLTDDALTYQVQGVGSATYSRTIYLKAARSQDVGKKIQIWSYNGTVVQNIYEPVLTADWVRFDAGTTTGALVEILSFGYLSSSTFPTTSGTDVRFYAWGAQGEASSYPTSYIPTTSSSATRVADACSKTGISSLIGQTEGVIFFDGYFGNEADEMYTIIQNSLGNGVTSSMYLIKSSSSIKFQSYDSSTTLQWEIQGGSYTIGQRIKIAGAYKANDIVLYVNGVQIGTDTSATIPTCTALQIGVYPASPTANFQYNGKVNQAILFPTRLTNAELASLTTI